MHALQEKMQCTFPKTTIVHCLAPQKTGLITCVDLKQARPSVAKVAQIAYEVAEQFPQLQTLKTMEEYNDTRRWRCYEAALLMKKNEIRTDEEAPLTTPVDASVLRYYRPSPEDRLQVARTIEGTEGRSLF